LRLAYYPYFSGTSDPIPRGKYKAVAGSVYNFVRDIKRVANVQTREVTKLNKLRYY